MLKPLPLIKGYSPSPHSTAATPPHSTAAPPLTVLQPLPSLYCSPSPHSTAAPPPHNPPLVLLQLLPSKYCSPSQYCSPSPSQYYSPSPHSTAAPPPILYIYTQVSGLNCKMTLEEVGLSPQETVFVEER